MSNEALTWAWKREGLGPEKFVLVALADFADEKASCWPSIARLAKMTGRDRRTVERHLMALEKAGLFRRERRRFEDGRLGGYRYFLAMFLGKSDPEMLPEPPDKMTGGENAKPLKTLDQPHDKMTGGTTRQKPRQPYDKMTGQEEPPLEPLEQQDAGARARAGPLPGDWGPDQALIQFAKTELHFTDEEIKDAIREFSDYWTAKARQRSIWRCDWDRAFKNRLRQLDPLWHRGQSFGKPGMAGGHRAATETRRRAWSECFGQMP